MIVFHQRQSKCLLEFLKTMIYQKMILIKYLIDLYNTNFFDLVSVKINNKILLIEVKENPIIQNINYEGIKSTSILEDLKKMLV